MVGDRVLQERIRAGDEAAWVGQTEDVLALGQREAVGPSALGIGEDVPEPVEAVGRAGPVIGEGQTETLGGPG